MPFSIFSTLPQISSQPPSIRWLVDPKLQRYIQKLDLPHAETIAYYLVTTTSSPNSNACLTALLAHIAFIPAHRLRSTHTLLQQYYTEDITDLYQIGLEIVSQPIARSILAIGIPTFTDGANENSICALPTPSATKNG